MVKREQSSVDSLYKDVPRKYVDELLEFRSMHPICVRELNGVEWHYILSGDGPVTVLILGGAMSTAETSRSLIQSLEKDFRVLAPAHPIFESIGAFIESMTMLLELESIQRTHIFGYSLGAGKG